MRHSQRAAPQVPGDPKVLVSALNPAALAAFHLTSLEAGGRWELPGEADLGAPLTVLDVAAYAAPASAQPLHPDDEALLEVGAAPPLPSLPGGPPCHHPSSLDGGSGLNQRLHQRSCLIFRRSKGLRAKEEAGHPTLSDELGSAVAGSFSGLAGFGTCDCLPQMWARRTGGCSAVVCCTPVPARAHLAVRQPDCCAVGLSLCRGRVDASNGMPPATPCCSPRLPLLRCQHAVRTCRAEGCFGGFP